MEKYEHDYPQIIHHSVITTFNLAKYKSKDIFKYCLFSHHRALAVACLWNTHYDRTVIRALHHKLLSRVFESGSLVPAFVGCVSLWSHHYVQCLASTNAKRLNLQVYSMSEVSVFLLHVH